LYNEVTNTYTKFITITYSNTYGNADTELVAITYTYGNADTRFVAITYTN
jgi:hypothetical protein